MNFTWIFTRNVFLLLAERSMKKFYKLVNYFFEALKSDNSISAISDITDKIKPFVLEFSEAYTLNKSQTANRIGDTNKHEDFFNQLRKDKAPDWNRKISVVFPPKTSEYIKILSKGLEPFSHASYDERLVYLENIITALNAHSQLSAVQAEVVSFRDDIKIVYNTQQQSSATVKSTSDDLKAKAEKMAKEMYGALGLLMYEYRDNPTGILKYIKVQLLRQHRSNKEDTTNIYELAIPAKAIKEGGFSFSLLQKLMMYNSGETKLRCWFGKDQNSPMPSKYFEIEADAELEISINQYANIDDRFFFIENLDATEEGSLEIEIE